MRMLPAVIAQSTKSTAERRLFRLMEEVDLGHDAAALHSLNLPQHLSKPVGEADFVVVSRAGVLVIEVKGGRVRRDSTGIWHYVDRHGIDHTSSEGPFSQAETAMWSIRDQLIRRLSAAEAGRLAIGFAVALPDVAYAVADSVDAPAELVLDRQHMRDANALRRSLERILARWRERLRRDMADGRTVAEATAELRRSFDLAPSLSVRSAQLVERLESLTEEQYAGLDWVQDHPRLLVSGGAGTGKTLLAVEIARRDALEGRRVLFTCRSHVLASFVRGRGLPDGLEVMQLDDAIEAVPARLPRFDCLVVDEAQDVFTADGIDALDALLEGGVDAGRWRCFFDVNNQSGFYGPLDDDALALLHEAAAGPPITLRRNCRNPRPVVIETRAATGADLGTPLSGTGPRVTFRHPADEREEGAMLAEEIARLTAGEVAAGAITIVSPRRFEHSPARLLPASLGARLRRIDAATACEWPLNEMTFAQVDDFKGLENDFVLICGLERLSEDVGDRARLYVAMSRPRYGLWIAVPQHLRADMRRLKLRNLNPAVEAIG